MRVTDRQAKVATAKSPTSTQKIIMQRKALHRRITSHPID